MKSAVFFSTKIPTLYGPNFRGSTGPASDAATWAKGYVNFIGWRAAAALFTYDKASNKFVHRYARPMYHACDDACGACGA
jgi:hypothetical protein